MNLVYPYLKVRPNRLHTNYINYTNMPKKSNTTNHAKEFHKAIRELIDSNKFDEIPKSTRNFIDSGGTPLPDTVSTIIANGDKFIISVAVSEPPMPNSSNWAMSPESATDFDFIIGLINPKDFSELTYTSLIKLYSNDKYFNLDGMMSNYEKMKRRGIPVKRRTLAPIFQNINDLDILMFFYSDSKVQDVILLIDDYLNILRHLGDHPYKKFMVIQDMVNTIDYDISIIHKPSFVNSFNINANSIPPPNYIVSKSASNKMLDQMKTYVGHFYGRNPSTMSNINKGMATLKKFKYDIVVDGANIGFYKQGVMSGKKISFIQLSKFVDFLVDKGHMPLIVLHKYHFDSANRNEIPIIESIMKNKKISLFIVPKGADDDWFWLYAALANPNAYLLTNDEMRNHFHYMNFDKTFINWKDTRVINYDIVNTIDDSGIIDWDYTIKIPDPFLKKIHLDMANNTINAPFINDDGVITWCLYNFDT